MGEFFNGWRRKAGCVALALALALMFLWLRSIYVSDIISRHVPNTSDYLFSTECSCGWLRKHHDRLINFPAPFWESFVGALGVLSEPRTRWREWRWYGCGMIESPGEQAIVWIIPYQFVVCPLTLISACLILWPRKCKPTRQVPPPSPLAQG